MYNLYVDKTNYLTVIHFLPFIISLNPCLFLNLFVFFEKSCFIFFFLNVVAYKFIDVLLFFLRLVFICMNVLPLCICVALGT